MAVAQHMKPSLRLYSLSRQLLASRNDYYDQLNRMQRGTLDATEWVAWFARQCTAAYEAANQVMDQALQERRFWEVHASTALNERQRKVLQRLLDDGDGGFSGAECREVHQDDRARRPPPP
jgi:Fic family protein